jgi:hypothetical protein
MMEGFIAFVTLFKEATDEMEALNIPTPLSNDIMEHYIFILVRKQVRWLPICSKLEENGKTNFDRHANNGHYTQISYILVPKIQKFKNCQRYLKKRSESWGNSAYVNEKSVPR